MKRRRGISVEKHGPQTSRNSGQGVLATDQSPTSKGEVFPKSSDCWFRPFISLVSNGWIGIVFLLVCWQPLELGFYMDDWAVQAGAPRHGAPFSAQRLQYLLEIDPSRPGAAVTRVPLTSVLGDHPALWQLAMLLTNILVAFGMFRAVQAIAGKEPIWIRSAVLGSALLWLLLPWSTSSQFWTIILSTSICLAGFAWMIFRLARPASTTNTELILWGLAYLWMCLSYEAFYGQFIAVLLICLGLAVLKKITVRAVLRISICLGTAQAVAVGWFFISTRTTSSQRTPGWGSATRALRILPMLPIRMLTSMPESSRIFSFMFLVLVFLSLWILWRSRRKWTDKRVVLGSAIVVLACVVGAVGSVFTFSAGGRLFVGMGVENRSFLFVSFWMVFLLALALTVLLRFAGDYSRWALVALAVACGLMLGWAHTSRALEWRAAWIEQRQILRDVPVKQLKAVEPDAAVLLINHLDIDGAPVFAAKWDINNALPLTYPELQGRQITLYGKWDGVMTWDGNHLGYAGQQPVAITRAVYIWSPAARSFQRAAGPFRVTQDLQVHFLH